MGTVRQSDTAAWWLYILRNERNALYTGITNNLARRLKAHRGKRAGGAKFTRGCRSLRLVYACEIGSRSAALKMEMKIKRLSKPRKEALVSARPQLHQLQRLLAPEVRAG